ncbi:MAG TPA: cytochrome c, partial [Ideonella sp.]|nr:cytochrome c [Ideonella sp.]
DGAAIYASLCVACHQATGAGLPGVFPPLAGSEWVNGKEGTAAAIVLHGVSGPLTVKGQTFNGAMPAFQAQLSDAQIAALLTHLRSHWGNASPPVTAQTVGQVREALKARTGPFAGDQELAALP